MVRAVREVLGLKTEGLMVERTFSVLSRQFRFAEGVRGVELNGGFCRVYFQSSSGRRVFDAAVPTAVVVPRAENPRMVEPVDDFLLGMGRHETLLHESRLVQIERSARDRQYFATGDAEVIGGEKEGCFDADLVIRNGLVVLTA